MEKFKATVRAFCPFHSNSEQRKTWNETKTKLIVVVNGVGYWKDENNDSFRADTRWREIPMSRNISIEKRLSDMGATRAEFRGGPRKLLKKGVKS